MGLGMIRISGPAVLSWLQLPSEYEHRGFYLDAARNEIIVHVEADAIPSAPEGKLLPSVTPIYGGMGSGVVLIDVEIRNANDAEANT